MATQKYRAGHVGLVAILEDMHDVLPPESNTRRDYRQCRQTYGLMKNFLNAAENDSEPEKRFKNYMEIQKLEPALRARLNALNPEKPIPKKMDDCLVELARAVAEIIEIGPEHLDAEVSKLDVAERARQEDDEALKMLERELAPPKLKVSLVPESKYKLLKEELRVAKAKIAQLNGENNHLAVLLRQVTAERDHLSRGTDPNHGRW